MPEKQYVKNLQMQIDEIKKKLDDIPTKHEMELSNEKLMQRVLKQADDRYASKGTERIVYTGVGIGLVWIFNQVLNLI